MRPRRPSSWSMKLINTELKKKKVKMERKRGEEAEFFVGKMGREVDL